MLFQMIIGMFRMQLVLSMMKKSAGIIYLEGRREKRSNSKVNRAVSIKELKGACIEKKSNIVEEK